ncbi:MAG TPA: hypothetical protein VNE40_00450 [Candidatus Dormibacteraeota bacterium]|nr:hypothetical protein [Candidatus Dormibacteraeota bacterium]
MNRLFKLSQLSAFGLSIGLASLALAPAIVSAAAPTTNPFCTNLSATVSRVNSNISNLENKMTTARSQQDQKLSANWAKWDQQIQANRAKWDGLRQADFAKLQAKAKTSTQQAAVQTYITAVLNAVSTRRAANDAARATYRSAVQTVIASQRTNIDSQVSTFTNAVNAAESTAQASCQATPSAGATIRVSFQTSMNNARQSFISDRKSDGTIGNQIKQLAQTRNASFKANNDAFLAAIKAAATVLKTAFGNQNI